MHTQLCEHARASHLTPQFDRRHGKGKEVDASGAVYYGSWRAGDKHGVGKLGWPNAPKLCVSHTIHTLTHSPHTLYTHSPHTHSHIRSLAQTRPI